MKVLFNKPKDYNPAMLTHGTYDEKVTLCGESMKDDPPGSLVEDPEDKIKVNCDKCLQVDPAANKRIKIWK